MEEKKEIPVYRHSSSYARAHNELGLYRQSYQANSACKQAIGEAVRENFDGMHLRKQCLTQVLEKHDPSRVAFVLAATLQYKTYDGRFSPSNQVWAKSITVLEEDLPIQDPHNPLCDFVTDVHPAVLDGFVSLFRKEMQTRETSPSLHDQLQQPSIRDKTARTASAHQPER